MKAQEMSIIEAICCCGKPQKKKRKLCSKKCEVLLVTLIGGLICAGSIYGFVAGLGQSECIEGQYPKDHMCFNCTDTLGDKCVSCLSPDKCEQCISGFTLNNKYDKNNTE
jgi:hypothetical protein